MQKHMLKQNIPNLSQMGNLFRRGPRHRHIFPSEMSMEKSYLIGTSSHRNGRWICPELGCSTTYLTYFNLKKHYLAVHMRARWPREYAETFGCDETFPSIYDAKQHVNKHYPKPRWLCQFDRCFSQIQGRKQTQVAASAHYKKHVQRGHFQEGECKPLKVCNNERTNEHYS